MGHYEDELRHIAEPADPSDRGGTTRVRLPDHTALWFARVLRGYAGYEADDDERRRVAEGYAEYIDRSVRVEQDSVVWLYAHTETAVETLDAAIECGGQNGTTAPETVVASAVEGLTEAFADEQDE